MTCAEARRQLSEPDSARAAEISAHLEGCAPCRGESESLKEVDRRLQRLGEVRRGAARALWARDPSLGRLNPTADGADAAFKLMDSDKADKADKGKSLLPASDSALPSRAVPGRAPAQLKSSLSPSNWQASAGRFVLLFCLISLLCSSLLWLLYRVRH